MDARQVAPDIERRQPSSPLDRRLAAVTDGCWSVIPSISDAWRLRVLSGPFSSPSTPSISLTVIGRMLMSLTARN